MSSRKQRTREYYVRQVNVSTTNVPPEVVASRNKRHLDELERSNFEEKEIVVDNDTEGSRTKGRARQTISDKRDLKMPGMSPAATKKKSTMNIRTALLYRKNLSAWIDESKIASLPSSVPTYLTAVTPASRYPPRLLCSVCGYWGRYKCKKCLMPYCDRNCEGIHDETRCERRVL